MNKRILVVKHAGQMSTDVKMSRSNKSQLLWLFSGKPMVPSDQNQRQTDFMCTAQYMCKCVQYSCMYS